MRIIRHYTKVTDFSTNFSRGGNALRHSRLEVRQPRCLAFSKNAFSKNAIFGGLVLGCVKTKFCKKICVRQHFSSFTRFAYFCTAAISKFSQEIGLKKQQFSWNFSKKIANVAKCAKFYQISKKFQLESLVDSEKCCKTHIFLLKSEQIQPKTSNICRNFGIESRIRERLQHLSGVPRRAGGGNSNRTC